MVDKVVKQPPILMSKVEATTLLIAAGSHALAVTAVELPKAAKDQWLLSELQVAHKVQDTHTIKKPAPLP